jgi:hypothetical protein
VIHHDEVHVMLAPSRSPDKWVGLDLVLCSLEGGPLEFPPFSSVEEVAGKLSMHWSQIVKAVSQDHYDATYAQVAAYWDNQPGLRGARNRLTTWP